MAWSSFLLLSRVAGSPGRIFLNSSLAASSQSSVWSLERVSLNTLPVASLSGKQTENSPTLLARNISRWVWTKASLASSSTSPVFMLTTSSSRTAPSSMLRSTGTALTPAFTRFSSRRRLMTLPLGTSTSLLLGSLTSSRAFWPTRRSLGTMATSVPLSRNFSAE